MSFLLRATGSVQEIDAAEVIRAAGHLFDPDFDVQISGMPFCNGNLRTVSASKKDDILRAIREVAGGAGTYYSLNPLPPGLTSHATADKPVRRRWLLVDADPAQHKINSTEEEHDAARDLACHVFDGLESDGWPQPISLDSGNGWHLLYRIDLPNDDASRQLCHDILAVLGSRYNTAEASIDTATATAKQIAKMPGTWARKSPHTKTNPQRMCKLHYVPTVIETVPLDVMKALAAFAEKKKPIRPPLPLPSPEHGPIWRCRANNDTGGRAYCKRALEGEAMRVRLCVKNRNDVLSEATWRISRRIHTGFVTTQEIESEMTLAATLNGLMDDPNDGPRKTLDCIKRAIQKGMEVPKDIPPLKTNPETNGHVDPPAKTNPSKGSEQPKDEKPAWETIVDGEVKDEGDPATWLTDASGIYAGSIGRQTFDFMSLPELLAAEFPEPTWVVPGILSEGLNILVGKPKIGKSLLSLNLGISIAAGGKALGGIQTAPGDVLYLALEDKGRRLKSRASKMMTTIGVQASRRLRILTKFPRQDCGGMDMLHYWADKIAERPALIIIDVLRQFRTPAPQRGNAYESDYQVMSWIKNLVDHHSCSALVVHHSRKGETDDPTEDTSGTNGLNGACDGILTLRKVRSSNEACIHITGRDVPGQELAIQFDDQSLNWKILGNAKEQTTSRIRKKILDAFKKVPGAQHWPKELAEMLGEDHASVKTTLWRMSEDGLLRKVGGTYSWPGTSESTEEF